MGRLLLQSALVLLTALGSVHWRQQPTSVSVNAVCRGMGPGVGELAWRLLCEMGEPPSAPEHSGEFLYVLPVGRGVRPSSQLLAWTSY